MKKEQIIERLRDNFNSLQSSIEKLNEEDINSELKKAIKSARISSQMRILEQIENLEKEIKSNKE
jgi:hypothetical protein